MRRFKRIGLWALILAAGAVSCCVAAEPDAGGGEIRALWVTRDYLRSRNQIDEFIDRAQKYNFNTVFVQVRGRGEAFYNSNIEPKALLKEDFDPLAYTISKGHQAKLKVHAWLNAYYVWSYWKKPAAPDHVLNRHPDWVMADKNGKSLMQYSWDEITGAGIEGYYLSPGIPAVNNYLYDVYMEVVRKYDVDGIHFDYIRYPSALREGWYGRRADAVSDLVRRVYLSVQKESPHVLVSAAVFPNLVQAKVDNGQAWADWLEEGIVDFVVPMAYGTNTARVRYQIIRAARNSRGRFVVAGLGAYVNSAASIIEKVNTLKTAKRQQYLNNLKGVVLFSYDELKDKAAYWEKLKRFIFPTPVALPKFPWKQNVVAAEEKR